MFQGIADGVAANGLERLVNVIPQGGLRARSSVMARASRAACGSVVFDPGVATSRRPVQLRSRQWSIG